MVSIGVISTAGTCEWCFPNSTEAWEPHQRQPTSQAEVFSMLRGVNLDLLIIDSLFYAGPKAPYGWLSGTLSSTYPAYTRSFCFQNLEPFCISSRENEAPVGTNVGSAAATVWTCSSLRHWRPSAQEYADGSERQLSQLMGPKTRKTQNNLYRLLLEKLEGQRGDITVD